MLYIFCIDANKCMLHIKINFSHNFNFNNIYYSSITPVFAENSSTSRKFGEIGSEGSSTVPSSTSGRIRVGNRETMTQTRNVRLNRNSTIDINIPSDKTKFV